MTLQIQGIAIYSHDGQRREIRFDLGRLNIVTGGPQTGKSSLLTIVDYCWGREDCVIPGGEIRRSVSWFAVLFDNRGEGVLVARRNVPVGERGSDEIYLERGADDFPDDPDVFVKNQTVAGIRATLTSLLGISENVHVPEPGSTRMPLEASASQAILFCLQDQDEIASKRILFHRQGEERIPEALKDVLPYFVGAMGEDHYLRQRRRKDARGRLRVLERRLAEMKDIVGEATASARRMAEDARRVGLLPQGPLPPDDAGLRAVLRAATLPQTLAYADINASGVELADLEEARKRLRAQLQEIRDELKDLRRIALDMSDFEVEVREQASRLASVGLVKDESVAHDLCPLCESRLKAPVPTVVEMRRSFNDLELQLSSVRRDNPRLQHRISDLEDARARLEEELTKIQADVVARIAQNERLRVEQDQLTERARVAGKVEHYLDNVRAMTVDASLPLEVAKVRAEIDGLDAGLDQEAVDERLTTAFNLIGAELTAIAKELGLEHGEGAVRLDRKNLTIVADTLEGPLPLSQIGSGANWVGYHVAAHLAIHHLFRARSRPVPAFLMLDQPSQAHYPPERDVGEIDGRQDEDQRAVTQLFRLLYEHCLRMAPDMQVIVVDHVELLQDWFREATKQRWRDGIKLVPMDWLR